MPLPTHSLYCPNLSCFVYDQIFKGWHQPLIGVFTLDIGKLMADLKQEREEETAVMWDIVNKLKKIVANPE